MLRFPNHSKHTLLSLLAVAALTVPAGFALAGNEDNNAVQNQTMHATFLTSLAAPPSTASICMVDTGVSLTPDTQGALLTRSTVDGTSVDDNNSGQHGTLLAGAIAGNVNNYGSVGMWPMAKIHSVRVTDDNGQVSMRRIALGINRCIELGASVIEIAQAGASIAGLENELTSAISAAKAADILVVAGSGNNYGGPVQYPAVLDGVIGVGASDSEGGWCAISARGQGIDLAAPGCDLSIAKPDGNIATGSGTSFSSAYVATAAAALRSYGTFTAPQTEQLLLASASRSTAGPVLNVQNAFSLAGLATGTRAQPVPLTPESGAQAKTPAKTAPVKLGKVTARKVKNSVVVTVANKPVGYRVLVRARGANWNSKSSKVKLRIAKVGKVQVALRAGAQKTPWKTVRVR
jgi:Subtilase family